MSKDTQNNSDWVVGFVIATFCALPFAIECSICAANLLFHEDWMVKFLFVSCLLGWPLLGIFALVGLWTIYITWTPSSSICKILLFLYAALIIGFAMFVFFPMAGMGPG
jgi:hypothetical protein